MDRRGFLAGILAAGCAPAIARVSKPMRLWVPAEKVLITPADPPEYRWTTGDFTIEGWVAAPNGLPRIDELRVTTGLNRYSYDFADTLIPSSEWDHIAVSRGRLWVNGELQNAPSRVQVDAAQGLVSIAGPHLAPAHRNIVDEATRDLIKYRRA